MSVQAKFVCNEVAKNMYGSARVSFHPVTSGSKENEQFWKYTPSGKIEMNIDNPKAAEQFEVGKEYYVNFTSLEESKKLVESPAPKIEKGLTEMDLINILGRNNKDLKEALEKNSKAKDSNCVVNIEDSARELGIESGEGLMLIKLIQYLRGEKKLEELS